MDEYLKCFISLFQLVLPENVDSLTAELEELRIQTFSTLEGAQRFVDKLKLLYNDSVRLIRLLWNDKEKKTEFERIEMWKIVAGEVSMETYRILSESFKSIAKELEVFGCIVRPSKYNDTIMLLPGLHDVNPMNRFDLNVGLDDDFCGELRAIERGEHDEY